MSEKTIEYSYSFFNYAFTYSKNTYRNSKLGGGKEEIYSLGYFILTISFNQKVSCLREGIIHHPHLFHA